MFTLASVEWLLVGPKGKTTKPEFSFLGVRAALMPNDWHLHWKPPEHSSNTPEASLISNLTAIPVKVTRFKKQSQNATIN